MRAIGERVYRRVVPASVALRALADTRSAVRSRHNLMAVDLHTHSSFSDGTDTPEEVIEHARRRRLAAIALTDHDTLGGIDRARVAAECAGIRFVPGIELSTAWGSRSLHLLAYWIEPGPGPLQDRLRAIRSSRRERNLEIVEALRHLGIDLTIEEIHDIAGEGVAGRPHFAAALVRRGVVATMGEAFDRYLAAGRPAYRPRRRLDVAEAVALAHDSGAVTAVAHPHTAADTTAGFEAAFAAFGEIGVGGVECHYSEYPPHVRRRLASLAETYGLIPTGGSDYHGMHRPGVDVGIGRGDLVVPDTSVAQLEDLRSGQRARPTRPRSNPAPGPA
jgi:predicted metal-dependent phosphoesterase TrpH